MQTFTKLEKSNQQLFNFQQTEKYKLLQQYLKTSDRSGVKKKEMALPSKTNRMAAHGNL